VLLGGPHDPAQCVLGIDVAVGIDDLDRCQSHPGSDTDDPDPVAGGTDDAGDMGAVAGPAGVDVGGPPGGRAAVGHAVDRAPDRLGGVDVGRQVGMVGVDAVVEDADGDVPAAVGDPVGGRG